MAPGSAEGGHWVEECLGEGRKKTQDLWNTLWRKAERRPPLRRCRVLEKLKKMRIERKSQSRGRDYKYRRRSG